MRSIIIAAGILLVAVAFLLTITGRTKLPENGRAPVVSAETASNSEASSETAAPDTRRDVLIPARSAPRAPALAEGSWVNSEPLTIEGLRGRVVIVDFWTYGCYNCRNTLPALKGWDAAYRDKGLTIIGVHTPEFDREKELDTVREQVRSLGIRYAVVTDNDNQSWNAYGIQAWPTVVILDKQGRIRWTHIGEGMYDEQERVIQKLLAE
ncbi:MAG: thioredoxin-like domain-containing protein [Pyrinomonadaceae bacterium]